MTAIYSVDARTGGTLGAVEQSTPAWAVRAATARASEALPWLGELGRVGRARLLDLLAEALESDADSIVATADIETALGDSRLRGELGRAAFQLRFMGQVALEGSYLDVSIEHPTSNPLGVVPDLRRTSMALGPVAVFGASNFPFAFGVPGGDTASALAAGCPVIAKAHSGHPRTSLIIGQAFRKVLKHESAPEGVFSLVFGREAGAALVTDPHIAAVGFTGSLTGGRELFNQAAARPNPIPFYGELGGVNPLVVTPAAAAERGREIGSGIAASMTLGGGQFCTKPGLFLLPANRDGSHVENGIIEGLKTTSNFHLLTDGIRSAFTSGTDRVLNTEGVRVLYRQESEPRQVGAVLISAEASRIIDGHDGVLGEEHFGPFGVVVRYTSIDQLALLLQSFPPALTGSVHSGADDEDLDTIVSLLETRSGRVVFDEYPTGVTVSWSMNHGGPYPASTSTSTSVGANALKRWIRPITYQNAPESATPDELKDSPQTPLPRRVDGVLEVPRSTQTYTEAAR